MKNVKYFIGQRHYSPYFLDRRVYGIFSLAADNINFLIDTSVTDEAVSALGNNGCLFKVIRQTVSKKSGKTLNIVVPVEDISDILESERNYSFLNAVDCILTECKDEEYAARFGQDVATKRFIKTHETEIVKAAQDDTVNIHDLFLYHQEAPKFCFDTAKLVGYDFHIEEKMETKPAYEGRECSYQCPSHHGYYAWDEESESEVLLSAEEIAEHWDRFLDAPSCIVPEVKDGCLFLSVDKNKVTEKATMISGFGEIPNTFLHYPAKISFGQAEFFIQNNKVNEFASIIGNIEIVGNYVLPAGADWRFDTFRQPGMDKVFSLNDKTYVSFDGHNVNSLYVPIMLMVKKYSGKCANATIRFSGKTLDTLRVVATFKE